MERRGGKNTAEQKSYLSQINIDNYPFMIKLSIVFFTIVQNKHVANKQAFYQIDIFCFLGKKI